MIEDTNNTLWCGNLAEQVTEELLYELFLQAGPLQKVYIAKDRDGRQKSYAFITFSHEVSVPYAINLFRGTALFNKKLTLQSRGGGMPLLPPPIRCYGPEPVLNFQTHPTVAEQFLEMTKQLTGQDIRSMHSVQQNQNQSELVLASLQGNWSHRHHPYRGIDNSHSRNNFRPRDLRDSNTPLKHGNRNNKPQHMNWRDRRHHRRGDYH